MRLAPIFVVAFALGGCPSKRTRPPGPPPEYEPPRVTAWDAGKPVDPLDQVQGEEVTDDDAPDATAPAQDAGAAPEATPGGG